MKFLTVIISLLLFTTNASALGKTGHHLVCQLAYELLPAEKKHAVDELISSLPISEQQLINKYNKDDENKTITFANTCTWADAIKRIDAYDEYKPWHYINVDRNDLVVDAKDCAENCLPRAIILHQNQLKTSADIKVKRQALMFLGHWLGDVHQPLHVSYKSDWGGNKVKLLVPEGTCNNLHWLWDSCLVFRTDKTESQLLAVLRPLTKLPESKTWLHQTPWQWATESLTIVRTPDFGYCKLNADNYCLFVEPSSDKDKLKLPDNYQQKHWPILQKRIIQASVRLAESLDQAL